MVKVSPKLVRMLIEAGKTDREIAAELGRTKQHIGVIRRMMGIDRPSKSWSAAEVRKLKAMLATDATHKQIAEALGRSVFAVGRKIHLMGWAGECYFRRRAFDTRVQIMGLRETGMKWADIARQLGRSQSQIFELARGMDQECFS